MLLVLATTGVAAQDTWTVAGSSAICSGKEWDPSATENDMTSTDGVNFTLVKEECVLEKGVNYEFKVVKNHAWGEEYPSQNYILTVDATGTYTVTFSFNSDTKDVSANTQKTGDAVIGDKTWTVAGSPAVLFGTEWDPTNTANDMEKQADGTYRLEIKGATLTADAVEYKVCANHAWSESYGTNGGNASFAVDEEGTYDVVFTFNTETKAVAATPTKASSGIDGVSADGIQSATARYDLSGREATDAQKGLNIVKMADGSVRKVMVK